MDDAELFGAKFNGADLTNADFTRARMDEADLLNTDVTGADLATYLGKVKNLPPDADRSGELAAAESLPTSSVSRPCS